MNDEIEQLAAETFDKISSAFTNIDLSKPSQTYLAYVKAREAIMNVYQKGFEAGKGETILNNWHNGN